MELIINPKKKERIRNSYQIIIRFMEGDADGYSKVKFLFHESRLQEPRFMVVLEEFIDHIIACIEHDKQGRGGFDSTEELIGEYRHIENWTKFCCVDEWLDTEDNKDLPRASWGSGFCYDVPSYSEGWYSSYDGYRIFYYDANGDRHKAYYKK